MNNQDLDLLKFCLENSDGTTPATIPDRDPQDYKWLREVFNSIETDVQKMRKIIELISDPTSTDEILLPFLEELQYLVEDIDNANDFWKVNGFDPVFNILKSDTKSEKLKSAASWVISTLLTNNPESQVNALKTDLFAFVIKELQDKAPTLSESLVFKLFGIITGLLKHQSDIIKQFVDCDGFKIIKMILINDKYSEQNKMKGIFSLRYILIENPELISSEIIKYNLLADLIPYLDSQSLDIREKTLQVFEAFLKANRAENKEECKKIGLETILKKKSAAIEKLEANESERAKEELVFINNCLSHL